MENGIYGKGILCVHFVKEVNEWKVGWGNELADGRNVPIFEHLVAFFNM